MRVYRVSLLSEFSQRLVGEQSGWTNILKDIKLEALNQEEKYRKSSNKIGLGKGDDSPKVFKVCKEQENENL